MSVTIWRRASADDCNGLMSTYMSSRAMRIVSTATPRVISETNTSETEWVVQKQQRDQAGLISSAQGTGSFMRPRSTA